MGGAVVGGAVVGGAVVGGAVVGGAVVGGAVVGGAVVGGAVVGGAVVGGAVVGGMVGVGISGLPITGAGLDGHVRSAAPKCGGGSDGENGTRRRFSMFGAKPSTLPWMNVGIFDQPRAVNPPTFCAVRTTHQGAVLPRMFSARAHMGAPDVGTIGM